MKTIFELSGTTLFEADLGHVPQIGTEVQFRTITYKKGLNASSLISVTIGAIHAPVYYLNSNHEAEVHISADGYKIIEEGPEADD